MQEKKLARTVFVSLAVGRATTPLNPGGLDGAGAKATTAIPTLS